MKLNFSQKLVIARVALSFVLLVALNFIPVTGWVKLLCFVIPYLIAGYDVLLSSVKNIARGQVFDENFLMSLATIGAFVIGEYSEAIFVMLFYQIGELFQNIAVAKSRNAISSLMELCADTARVEKDGELIEMLPEEVEVGSIILIMPGERIPLDGIIIEGTSTVDTSALTGESLPAAVTVESSIFSGCINLEGVLKVKVTKPYEESTAARILALVEESAEKKATSERFITRFSKFYTPIVVVAAVLLAVLPPLLLKGEWTEWIHRSLLFLVVSCPCALVISVPLTYFAGMGGASKLGILVKGSSCLDTLSKVDTVIMDKTGTLTSGKFAVTGVYPKGISAYELTYYAAHAEAYSKHPLSKAVCEMYEGSIDYERINDVHEYAGKGVASNVCGKAVRVGNAEFVGGEPLSVTAVHVSIDDKYCGYIELSDAPRSTAKDMIAKIKKLGVKHTVMLTGDRREIAEPLSKDLAIDDVKSELLPEDKVREAERIISKAEGRVAYVGDGINDAPVLMRADVGIAMGAFGSDAAIEAADMVLMNDSIEQLPYALALSRKVRRIVIQNIVFALFVKGAVLITGAFGIATMWEAVFADVGVSVIAILNAMRALRKLNLD